MGDKKVTMEDGTDYDYQDKLFLILPQIIVGSSGVVGLLEKFTDRVQALMASKQNISAMEFITEVENITGSLNKTYFERLRGQVFDVLLGIKTPGPAVLKYIMPIGFSENVRKHKAIGHGAPYGAIFLKQLWRPDMIMEQVAELGHFVIKYIEKYELDGSVGVGSGHPQIWFIPDNPPLGTPPEEMQMYNQHQADQPFLDRIKNDTQERLEKYKTKIEETFNLLLASRAHSGPA